LHPLPEFSGDPSSIIAAAASQFSGIIYRLCFRPVFWELQA